MKKHRIASRMYFDFTKKKTNFDFMIFFPFTESTSIMMKEMKKLHKSVSCCKETNDVLNKLGNI